MPQPKSILLIFVSVAINLNSGWIEDKFFSEKATLIKENAKIQDLNTEQKPK